MRGLKRFFFTVLTLGIVGTLAVVGTVWALNTFTSTGPLAARCTAEVGDLGTQALAPDQTDNAALITAIAMQRELPARAATIGIATAMQESKMRNIDYGDRDSLGMFQQRPSQGWGTAEEVQDPRYATEAFYDVLARIEGYDDMQVTVAAQAVQRSAFPDAYAQHEDVARAFASALTGHAPATLNCRLHEAEVVDIPGFEERIALDFPGVEVTGSGPQLLIGSGDLKIGGADDPDRALWALAQWAVAVADTYGIESVTVAGQTWTRQEPWSPIDEDGGEDAESANNSAAVTVTFAKTD